MEVYVLSAVVCGQRRKHSSHMEVQVLSAVAAVGMVSEERTAHRPVEGSVWSRPVRWSLKFSSLSDPSSFSVRVQRRRSPAIGSHRQPDKMCWALPGL